MKINRRTVPACLSVGLACLAVPSAQAQSVSPLEYPTLTYFFPQPLYGQPSGYELIGLRLTGFVFNAGDLSSLTPEEFAADTIGSLGESGFEGSGGTVKYAAGITPPSSAGANDGDLDWVWDGDLKLHPPPAIPTDPLPPSDPTQPLDFEILSSTTNSAGEPVYDYPFTLTNVDGNVIGTIIPDHPFVPFAATAVPEPSSLALLVAGLFGLPYAARRCRRS